jgi:hypothetical protein
MSAAVGPASGTGFCVFLRISREIARITVAAMPTDLSKLGPPPTSAMRLSLELRVQLSPIEPRSS